MTKKHKRLARDHLPKRYRQGSDPHARVEGKWAPEPPPEVHSHTEAPEPTKAAPEVTPKEPDLSKLPLSMRTAALSARINEEWRREFSERKDDVGSS